MDQNQRLTAWDAIHAAASRTAGNRTICSYDTDFDELAGITRVTPEQVAPPTA